MFVRSSSSETVFFNDEDRDMRVVEAIVRFERDFPTSLLDGTAADVDVPKLDGDLL